MSMFFILLPHAPWMQRNSRTPMRTARALTATTGADDPAYHKAHPGTRLGVRFRLSLVQSHR